jgi:hypothetical protein
MKKTPEEMIQMLEELTQLEGLTPEEMERFTDDLFYFQAMK